ncbi:LPS export ABC transporter periplasmic protein LptC [Sphingomonas sp.]|jgi:lipopolysaccharide export system protein LptC|uniref:LPS export ABC transporter periplasmic protein LptC n=1 Tax=Sphingomonas sp. TaxID=28214 RepID=UPI002D806CE0|nr:LPS export ABC transporter periplasmic protein LptC [Sphingomonas sp.]HEU0043249.1 LPS export ABC transporter periplasmic protein LptC [Sphingomonas sp.]
MLDARPERTARQLWAAPGGRHDRLIGTLSFMLPVGVGVLAAFLVMAPIYSGGDVSFVLDKNKVEVAKERMKIQRAQYRGQDAKGQAFTLDAGSALQRSSAEPVVELNALDARIELTDGPARLHADKGRYDMDTEQVDVAGPIQFLGPNGYRLDTRDATVDLKARKLASGGAVTGSVRQGTFSANRLRADLESRTVTLAGNARLRIQPRGPK